MHKLNLSSMKSVSSKHIIVLLLSWLLVIPILGKSQFEIWNPDLIERIKGDTTYVAMLDPTTPIAQEYIDVFEKYWTLSSLKFIKYTDIDEYAKGNRSFFTISGFSNIIADTKLFEGANPSYITLDNIYVYLELWACPGGFPEKPKKKGRLCKISAARIALFPNLETMRNPRNIYDSDYDVDGHIYNWGPGVLGNYIQQLMALCEDKPKAFEKRKFQKYTDGDISFLKKDTLYIPEYTLLKFQQFTGRGMRERAEENVLEAYPFPYKVISMEELNRKIANDSNPFYYLIYIKDSNSKFVMITESTTGTVLYSNYTPISYNFHSKDLKRIAKEID